MRPPRKKKRKAARVVITDGHWSAYLTRRQNNDRFDRQFRLVSVASNGKRGTRWWSVFGRKWTSYSIHPLPIASGHMEYLLETIEGWRGRCTPFQYEQLLGGDSVQLPSSRLDGITRPRTWVRWGNTHRVLFESREYVSPALMAAIEDGSTVAVHPDGALETLRSHGRTPAPRVRIDP